MSKREPIIRFYTDENCTLPLNEKSKLALCEAGGNVIYDVYARNEGILPLESWDIFVQGWYQVLKDELDPKKGYDLVPTTDVSLMSTPRSKRLESGQTAHLRVSWKPPATNYWPIIWKIAAGGPYIISPFD